MNLNLNLIIDNIATPIVVFTPVFDEDKKNILDFNIIYKNKKMDETVGYILGNSTKWSDFSNKVASNIRWFEMARDLIINNQTQYAVYHSIPTKSWYKIDMNYHKESGYLTVTFLDITSERKYYQKLKESLITDSLTGLVNRNGFIDALETALDTARYEDKSLALLTIDIDNLKNINDSIGPAQGDEIIKKASKILAKFERDTIQLFRYGDDEFAVIISGLSSGDMASTVTDAIFEAFQLNQMEVSGGISLFPDHTELKEELIRFADMAVNYSKKHGKNTFTFFTPDMQRILIQKLTMQSRMTTAILESNFRLYYQPQFDIKTKTLRGFEALIRWHDEELGDIPPSVFIPLAEETGLILPIGRWVMNSALQTLKHWQEKFDFKGIISINVSPIQLAQENFLDELLSLIKKLQIDPVYVEIEITEGIMINNMKMAIDKLGFVKNQGFRVSLDDFGTGYSSLSYLQQLPLDTLKIDKSFINDIAKKDGVQANITSSIIHMVENMGLETIAEGVEHPEQLDILSKLQCTIVQGFLQGKPMPASLCENYLSGDSSVLLKGSN